MSRADPDRMARAAQRARTITIRKTTVGDEQDLSPLRGAEAISLATQLSREAFSLAGHSPPAYDREHIPVRFVPRRRA